ncbi:hypothetical protein XANCAGTX0491_003192 [Xanthoria calcicola]
MDVFACETTTTGERNKAAYSVSWDACDYAFLTLLCLRVWLGLPFTCHMLQYGFSTTTTRLARQTRVSFAVPHVSSSSKYTFDNAISRRLLVGGGKLMKLQTKRPHRFAKTCLRGVFTW